MVNSFELIGPSSHIRSTEAGLVLKVNVWYILLQSYVLCIMTLFLKAIE